MARPRWHALTTLPIATLAYLKWGPLPAAAAITGGVLIDGDHLIDYAWTRARGGRKTHYLAPLHGWEVASALAVVALMAGARHRWAAALAAGVWLHLAQDVVINRPQHAGVYSLLYRARHGFRREATGWTEEGGFHNWSALSPGHWWKAL